MNNQFEKMQKLAFGKVITESNPQSLTESSLKDKIKELVHSSLGEAKKKKKEPEDVAPQEDIMDMDIEAPSDTITPSSTDEIDIDPKVKAIQDSLSKALANAKALGDEKLTNQIGNTITMLVRTQVVGQQQVAEIQGDPDDFGKWDDGHHQSQYAEKSDENDVVKDYVDLLRGYVDDIYDVYNIMKAVEIIKKEFSIKENINENYDLNKAFQNSPTEYSYNEVLSLIESYEDEDILNEFKAKFPEGKSISKESYYNFTKAYIDDMSEISYIKANWISLSDEDVFEKAGLV